MLTANTVSAEIKVWLAAQKTDAVAVNNILKQADWETAHAAKTDSLTYLVVKLAIDQQKFDDLAKTVNRYLVIVKNNGVVKEGYLYDVFGDAAQINKYADDYIAQYSKNMATPLTGNLTKYTLMNSF